MKKIKISIIGLGFVGLSLAAVNAKKEFLTIGIDIDKKKLDNLKKGIPDIFEPQLKEFLKYGLKKKTLVFSDELETILKTDITFVTVGTPSNAKGEINLDNFKNVIYELSKILKHKNKEHLIVVKSTVIPTTCMKVVEPLFKNHSNVKILMNPEFLREGRSIKDLLEPHLVVIGCQEKKSCKQLLNYYKIFYKKLPEIIETDLTTAEMIKYTNNVFLATKISFINTIANICQNLPFVDVNQIARAIGKDSRIGSEFLHAGAGFGGSCLPKDLSALINFSNKFGKTNQLLKAVQDVNQLQPKKVIQMIKEMNLKSNSTIAILGLAFKRDTDDIRDSVSIQVVNDLLKSKYKVRVHDPMAISNFKAKFANKIEYYENIQSCIKDSDCCIILTDWNEYKKLKPSFFMKNLKTKKLIDAKRIFDPSKFSKIDFKAIGLGEK
jgi:UDPglucose 6-dehydrogenase